jgi:hypothetical protein
MSERTLHRAVCDYIRLQYPDVIFNTDLSGATKLTVGQAVALKSLRSGRGFPDIVIYEPRKDYHGLFLELKQEGERLFNKNGELATPHLREQNDMLCRLEDKGYCSGFVVGFDQAKIIIDNYLKITDK